MNNSIKTTRQARWGKMHLKRDTVQRLFAIDSPCIHHDEKGVMSFVIVCTVYGGERCYFPEAPHDPSLGELQRLVIKDLGPKFVEHSKDNQLMVRCQRATDSDGTIVCEVNRGYGWKTLPVE